MKTYFDIVGDGGSHILDQVVAQKEAIERNLRGVERVLAVGSGKGGVGKSTVTLQLARAMARQGFSCAILDADLNGPSQAHLTGLHAVPLLPGRTGLAMPRTADGLGVVSMGSVVPAHRDLDFDSFAKGSSQTWRATKEFTLFGELLASVEWGRLDMLLIDLPPGAERTFQFAEFLGPRAAFVLVTVPAALSRGVVLRSVAALERTKSEVLGYVNNMCGYYCEDCGRVKPLFPQSDDSKDADEQALAIPLLGEVPFDPVLAARCDRGEPDTGLESRQAVQEFRRIAGAILERLPAPSHDEQRDDSTREELRS